MTTEDNESSETPDERIAALDDATCREALYDIVTAILEDKHPRDVPDILHRYRLLSKFEVYDADESARP